MWKLGTKQGKRHESAKKTVDKPVNSVYRLRNGKNCTECVGNDLDTGGRNLGKKSSYDLTLFEGIANYYIYRPPYADALVDNVMGSFGLDGKGKALDLGCGIGNMAIPFALTLDRWCAWIRTRKC